MRLARNSWPRANGRWQMAAEGAEAKTRGKSGGGGEVSGDARCKRPNSPGPASRWYNCTAPGTSQSPRKTISRKGLHGYEARGMLIWKHSMPSLLVELFIPNAEWDGEQQCHRVVGQTPELQVPYRPFFNPAEVGFQVPCVPAVCPACLCRWEVGSHGDPAGEELLAALAQRRNSTESSYTQIEPPRTRQRGEALLSTPFPCAAWGPER
ncbi:hypothetical protein QBC47DRAFT_155567 [Echria macrotheca]|uniref:Uncharacterized protein n=1 Tax=Echria macrotheca TaxID=438768 RepID=A0AAJ0BFM2_9PEZI|nr:hypothetical protein QBC47DRAFT_155567 [Echria macrotheca]